MPAPRFTGSLAWLLALVGVSACGPERTGEASAAGAAAPPADAGDASAARRRKMVQDQLVRRGISDPRVLEAMASVPRERFVPPELRGEAHRDSPLPIGEGQTISQPYVVAFMTEALELDGSERVLEIGTGSGYQAAILGELAREVYTIEIVPSLAERAREVLAEEGHDNVHVRAGNGWLGWPEHAPFDAIIVTAAPDRVPQALVDQLAPGGRMIVPVGERDQDLTLLTKDAAGHLRQTRVLPVRFVPMTGDPDGD